MMSIPFFCNYNLGEEKEKNEKLHKEKEKMKDEHEKKVREMEEELDDLRLNGGDGMGAYAEAPVNTKALIIIGVSTFLINHPV